MKLALSAAVLLAAAAMLVVAVALFTTGPALDFWNHGRFVHHGNEDWRSAVRFLNETQECRRWPVFVASGLIEADALRTVPDDDRTALSEYCLLPVSGIYRLHREGRDVIPLPATRPGRMTEGQLELIADRPGCWLLIRGPETVAAATRDLKEGLDRLDRENVACRVVGHKSFGPGLTLVRISTDPK